jgi:hypothetical protein
MQVRIRYRSIVSACLNKYSCIPYIFIALALQLISLFRKYPTNHPCGRVVSVNNLSLIINCDSAIFMKDAQDPIRLFNGSSVYQDRPLPTLIVSTLSKIWHYFAFPDYYRNVVGNSGISYNYSLVTYGFFLLMNAFVLSIACWLGLNLTSKLFTKNNIDFAFYPVVACLIVSVISMNEITKTFFWTPHSQMFNLLLPIYFFYLLQFRNIGVSSKFYIYNCLALYILLFSYAFFILLVLPLIIIGWKSFKIRVSIIFFVTMAYFSYPVFMELLGGNYYSLGFEKYRLFIWFIDALSGDTGAPLIKDNFYEFIKTFPILPICLISLILLCILLQNKKIVIPVFKVVNVEFLSFFIYLSLLSVYGYYARRLTYSLIIFLILILVKIILYNFRIISSKLFMPMSIVIFGFIFFSWLFTNGPLV